MTNSTYLIKKKTNLQQTIGNSGHFRTALLFLLIVITGSLKAQISGIKTIPGDYNTIALAVAALNSSGVGSGGVTFNVAAGYTETITARINLTATGTAANPIVFQKSGAG